MARYARWQAASRSLPERYRELGGYRTIAADQPQSLSVMEMLGRRVPYRRIWTAEGWVGCAHRATQIVLLCRPVLCGPSIVSRVAAPPCVPSSGQREPGVQLPETPDADTTALAIKRNLSCMGHAPVEPGPHWQARQVTSGRQPASTYPHIETGAGARADYSSAMHPIGQSRHDACAVARYPPARMSAA